jgi:STIMATE family
MLGACRCREKPPRPFNIWAMDISKQVVASFVGHFTSIFIAMLFQLAGVGKRQTSECSWYFAVYCVGCTVGVALALWLHAAVMYIARSVEQPASDQEPLPANLAQRLLPTGLAPGAWADIAACGDYGHPPRLKRWSVQVCASGSACRVRRAACCVGSTKLPGVTRHAAR